MHTFLMACILWLFMVSPLVEQEYVPQDEPKAYREVLVEVTAYNSVVEQCGKADGITASGVVAIEGVTIAADDLPFGTKVEIYGKTYVVQDTFGGNYRNRIDIYFGKNVSRANEFGRREILVKILEED